MDFVQAFIKAKFLCALYYCMEHLRFPIEKSLLSSHTSRFSRISHHVTPSHTAHHRWSIAAYCHPYPWLPGTCSPFLLQLLLHVLFSSLPSFFFLLSSSSSFYLYPAPSLKPANGTAVYAAIPFDGTSMERTCIGPTMDRPILV